MQDQWRKMEDEKLRFQQQLEGSMANNLAISLASHKADIEQQMGQQFAKQMAEMRAMMEATLTSKDKELADAQVAIGKAHAESRDAAGQIQAETAAAQAW